MTLQTITQWLTRQQLPVEWAKDLKKCFDKGETLYLTTYKGNSEVYVQNDCIEVRKV